MRHSPHTARGSPWQYRKICSTGSVWGWQASARLRASNSKTWTTRTPAFFRSPFPIHPGIRNWRSLHRPLFPGTRPEETACHPGLRDVDLDRESIWISYCPMAMDGHEPDCLGRFASHHRLATPVSPWERLKIGGGTPPVLTRHGWLIVYHGVSEMAQASKSTHPLCYSAGVMVLSKEHPQVIRYRSADPVLTPSLPQERDGTVANVVFPTGIDRRDDLGIAGSLRHLLRYGRQPNWRGAPEPSGVVAAGRRSRFPARKDLRIAIMKPAQNGQSPGKKSDAQKDLKSIPMEEFQKKTGFVGGRPESG